MTTILSMRFSKTICLNFHHHHCFSLITNCFNTIIIDSSWTKQIPQCLYEVPGTSKAQAVLHFKMFYGKPRIFLSYQASKMLLFYVGQITCSKIHLKTLQIESQKLCKPFNPAIIQSILPLVVYSLVMPACLLIRCLLKRSSGKGKPKKLAESIFSSIEKCNGIICNSF